ncbi:MAG: hypothetical protein Q9209_006424 [Squamulea sp. 1 TL-2023]
MDHHALENSATVAPPHTCSEPLRGAIMPHSSREPADFVSKLHGITEVRKANDTSSTSAHSSSQHMKKVPSLQENGTLFNNGTPEKYTSAVQNVPTDSILIYQPSVLEQPEVEEMAEVSIMDGSASISFASKIQVLVIYFAFNLGLTLYNKAVMIKFPFPFLLTALHALSGMVGTQVLLSRGVFNLKNLTNRDTALLSAFSILYTANIAVSNVSLAMVTVPLHQTVRAMTPVFTVAIYRVIFHGIYGTDTYISLAPVIMGVMLASYGDLNANVLGFLMTMLGTILAAVKTVTTNRLQTAGLHLGALELLYRMSPIACIQSLAIAYVCGEFDGFDVRTLDSSSLSILLVNGAIAFGLNVASFEANKRSGALTMTIAANIKQVLTIVLSIALWHIPVGMMNAYGIALTLVGGVWYGRVELVGKTAKKGENQLEEGIGKV